MRANVLVMLFFGETLLINITHARTDSPGDFYPPPLERLASVAGTWHHVSISPPGLGVCVGGVDEGLRVIIARGGNLKWPVFPPRPRRTCYFPKLK